jgi:hypothetical protein
MSSPKVGSSRTSSLASIAMTSARCSCTIMPLDSSRTRWVCLILVRARKRFAFSREKRGCTPADEIDRFADPQPGAAAPATSAMKQTCCISSVRCERRIEAEHGQFAVELGQTEDRAQRGGLAGAVRSDQGRRCGPGAICRLTYVEGGPSRRSACSSSPR